MITKEGYYDGLIQSIEPIKNRFGKAGFELYAKVGIFDADGKTPLGVEEVFMEVSDAYGQPPMNDRTQKQITLDTLKSIGFQFGEDLSKLSMLNNVKCRIKAKLDTKKNMRFYFSSHREVEKISVEDAMKMMAAIGGGATASATSPFNATQSQAPAATSTPNPFTGMMS